MWKPTLAMATSLSHKPHKPLLVPSSRILSLFGALVNVQDSPWCSTQQPSKAVRSGRLPRGGAGSLGRMRQKGEGRVPENSQGLESEHCATRGPTRALSLAGSPREGSPRRTELKKFVCEAGWPLAFLSICLCFLESEVRPPLS